MRTKTLLKSLPVVTGLLCTSCMGLYYQLYETDPLTDNVKSVEGALVYEDANCMVVYDFWQEAGNAGFAIVNKTAKVNEKISQNTTRNEKTSG